MIWLFFSKDHCLQHREEAVGSRTEAGRPIGGGGIFRPTAPWPHAHMLLASLWVCWCRKGWWQRATNPRCRSSISESSPRVPTKPLAGMYFPNAIKEKEKQAESLKGRLTKHKVVQPEGAEAVAWERRWHHEPSSPGAVRVMDYTNGTDTEMSWSFQCLIADILKSISQNISQFKIFNS